MFRKIFIVAMAVFGMGFVSCSKNYCRELATKTCKQVPGTKACRQAKTMTNKTSCKTFLAGIDKYIKLTNLKIDKPPLKPPAVQKKEVKKPVKAEKTAPAAEKVNDATGGNAAKDVPKSATAPPVPTAKPKAAPVKKPAK